MEELRGGSLILPRGADFAGILPVDSRRGQNYLRTPELGRIHHWLDSQLNCRGWVLSIPENTLSPFLFLCIRSRRAGIRIVTPVAARCCGKFAIWVLSTLS